ncbi:MAG: hypothetical protein K5841_01305 [Fretibacterium sp.]|nr:hypothetical protein [Fretibacterium sp.]
MAGGEAPSGLRTLVETGDLMPLGAMGGNGYVLTPGESARGSNGSEPYGRIRPS